MTHSPGESRRTLGSGLTVIEGRIGNRKPKSFGANDTNHRGTEDTEKKTL